MTFQLNSNVIRNPEGKVKFKKFRPDGYEHYHIGVWLDADTDREMDHVQFVEYELHPSFRRRERRSYNRENDFSVTFWSWGTFEITARIHLAGEAGEVITVKHQLEYDLPDDDGQNYIDVTKT